MFNTLVSCRWFKRTMYAIREYFSLLLSIFCVDRARTTRQSSSWRGSLPFARRSWGNTTKTRSTRWKSWIMCEKRVCTGDSTGCSRLSRTMSEGPVAMGHCFCTYDSTSLSVSGLQQARVSWVRWRATKIFGGPHLIWGRRG